MFGDAADEGRDLRLTQDFRTRLQDKTLHYRPEGPIEIELR